MWAAHTHTQCLSPLFYCQLRHSQPMFLSFTPRHFPDVPTVHSWNSIIFPLLFPLACFTIFLSPFCPSPLAFHFLYSAYSLSHGLFCFFSAILHLFPYPTPASQMFHAPSLLPSCSLSSSPIHSFLSFPVTLLRTQSLMFCTRINHSNKKHK